MLLPTCPASMAWPTCTAVMFGYRCRSSAILGDHEGASGGEPGACAPHVMLERDGVTMSTLDLFGAGFVLLAGSAGGPSDAPREPAESSG